MFKNVLAVATLLLLSVNGNAQGFTHNSGSLSLSYLLQPERKFKNASGGYKYTAFAFNAKVPLFGSVHAETRHVFKTFVTADIQSASASFGVVSNDRQFLHGSLALGGFIFSGGKNIYLFNATAGMAADTKVIDNGNSNIRFTGSFMVNRRQSQNTMYVYGGVFTYAYAKPLLLPILGLRAKLSPRWTFTTILPVLISFTDKLNAKTGLSFTLRPSGNRFQFSNQENFSTASSTVFMQLRDFRLGMGFYYKTSPSFTISADAGLVAGGKLDFTEQTDNKISVFKTGLKPGGLFQLTLRYRLPHKKDRKVEELDDLLNPMDN